MGKRGYVAELGRRVNGLRLRPDQEVALAALVGVHGKTRAELIREAVDLLITKLNKGESK